MYMYMYMYICIYISVCMCISYFIYCLFMSFGGPSDKFEMHKLEELGEKNCRRSASLHGFENGLMLDDLGY